MDARAARSAQTMERILDAALACIGRTGYDGTSMQDIAGSAGVSKALVHYHFQTKHQLFLEVQARAFRSLATTIDTFAATGGGSVDRALEALDQLWRLLREFRDQVPFTLELWAQSTRHPDFRAAVETFSDEMIGLISRGLRATLGVHFRRLPMPPERLARVLHLSLWGLHVQTYFSASDGDAEQTYQDLRALLGRALKDPLGAS